MSVSPFFLDLYSAYEAELDDLRLDSDGRDVLRQRLADKRKEIDFLLQMMELSPEMVAVIFHQAFRFKAPALMEHLLSLEADEFPDWSELAEGIELSPWAGAQVRAVLSAPGGEWFMAVAAGLEFMASRPAAAPAHERGGQHETSDGDGDGDDERDEADDAGTDDEDEGEQDDSRARREAGADWLAAQGFDRKD